MSTSAKVVADSISPAGQRIITLQLVFPRIILAEFNTHRAFSRNAASSRAIPVKKMLEQVKRDPFVPKYWGKNQPGMQAPAELEDFEPYSTIKGKVYTTHYAPRPAAKKEWLAARDSALKHAQTLTDIGLHKQLANRLLEPWMWSHVVVTATDFGNFFNLRIHPDAQPEMKELAEAMWEAIRGSTPQEVAYGDWHLPYVTSEDRKLGAGDYPSLPALKKLSVARCARVSYMNHDGTYPDLLKDLELHNRLAESGHWSPFEHQATPIDDGYEKNFYCWRQYRSQFENENRKIYTGS